MPEIVAHHLEDSRSLRVLWLLEELELPYEIRRYARNAKTMRAPDALRAVHPLGKAPVVVVDGVVLAETGAIVETLVDEHGRHLKPEPGTDAARRYRYFLHYAEGSLAPPLLVRLIMAQVARAPLLVRPVAAAIARSVNGAYTHGELERHFAFLEAELADREHFAGDAFTAADIMLSFPIEAAACRGAIPIEAPRLHAWLDRIHARPAWQRALERGGPYAYATR
jgi:glutathione S-transferase